MIKKAYQQSVQAIAKSLHVSPSEGLSNDEVVARQVQFGRNELQAEEGVHPLALLLGQFKDILIIVLIVAATISLALSFVDGGNATARLQGPDGAITDLTCQEATVVPTSSEWSKPFLCDESTAAQVGVEVFDHTLVSYDEPQNAGVTQSLLIYGIVIAIALIGFFNEYKAERTVEALMKLVGQNARVRRNGEELQLPAAELVPGDIVLLEEGVKIPADIRLLTTKALMVNEASLTGESVPASKTNTVIAREAPLGDQKNMAFSGTIVASGVAEGVVVATGQQTEIGRIAQLVNDVEEEQTPLQKKLDDLGRKLGAIILGISIFVFVIIYFFDKDLVDESALQRIILAFTAAVALAVAAIPEGLAFVVRISLALGARRMATKNALVRKLSAVEALGSTDTVCSDKTGTLTRGEMTVRALWTGGARYEISGTGYDLEGTFTTEGKQVKSMAEPVALLRIGLLCNNAHVKDGVVLGDPTEGSLLVSAAKAGIERETLQQQFPRLDEVPFSSDRKRMSTVHGRTHTFLVAAKGAADVLLEHCDRVVYHGKIVALTPKIKKEIIAENGRMAKQALRVLGFAYKEVPHQPKGDKQIEKELIFAGLQGMMDPPRTEVKEVMHRIHAEAGMRVIMITGDHVDTATAVAKEIGILGHAISGAELDQMTQAEFEKKVEKISVYARVNPEHKIRIVQALKKHGHQVAMTGDGVNDAPAIKAADIGIAMGITGTDAAKEAADLILLDDQFVTIIDAIEEGRGIFDNVRKFVNYLLGANVAEVLVILSGVLFLNRLLLSAAQLLFINIVTDGLPAVALGSDPAERGIMRFKPHRFQGAIIDGRAWLEMGLYGIVLSIIMVTHFWWILNTTDDLIKAGSIMFASLVVYELVRLITHRTDYNIPWFSNPWLSVSLVSSFMALLAVMYIPFTANLFGVAPISSMDWVAITVISVGLFIYSKLLDKVLDKKFPETAR